MMFVDGENFAINGRKLLEGRGVKLPEEDHPRRFTTSSSGLLSSPERAPRCRTSPTLSSFFHSASARTTTPHEGAPIDVLNRTREHIWRYGFSDEVFKRRENGKSKGVDIALSKDMLVHAFEGHFETAVLVAGDADYAPLVREVKRRGPPGRPRVLRGQSGAESGLPGRGRCVYRSLLTLRG